MSFHYRLSELIHGLEVSLKGEADCIINGISPIQEAQPGHITFLNNALYQKYLSTTQASAVILNPAFVDACPVNAVISDNPYYIYAKIAGFFDKKFIPTPGVHSTALLGMENQIDPSASIGPKAIIGNQVTIGPHVNIGPGCIIGDHVEIEAYTQLDAHVTIYHNVRIGKRSRVASGAVIGSDGFGFAHQNSVWHKIPQLGRVIIGDDVDIGANTTIDRGALGHTIIENGVKLDNLIQVGHNVKIGEHTIIAGCVAIAGSVTIGKGCMIGGATCFAGHITICDHAIITGMTAVTKSIREPGMYSSGIVGAVPNKEFRKNNARFHRLENLMERVKKLELAMNK